MAMTLDFIVQTVSFLNLIIILLSRKVFLNHCAWNRN
jgi:hypothetical protein